MFSVASAFFCCNSMISKTIPEITRLIWESLQPLVFKRLSVENLKIFAEEFQSVRGFPHVIGAMDGKHIRVVNFDNKGSLYFNYKKYFSIILLAMCDANNKFTYVDIGAPGSLYDASVWQRSSLHAALKNGDIDIPSPSFLPQTDVKAPYIILADDAFALSEIMLVPWPGRTTGKLTDDQINFNHHQSSTRIIIENTFGILTAKWRRRASEVEDGAACPLLYLELLFTMDRT